MDAPVFEVIQTVHLESALDRVIQSINISTCISCNTCKVYKFSKL